MLMLISSLILSALSRLRKLSNMNFVACFVDKTVFFETFRQWITK